MQSDDVRRMLSGAAAEPSRPLDARVVLAEGTRLRRVRLAVAATGLAVMVAGASAALAAYWPERDGDLGPGPAGTRASVACELDFGPALEVVVFLKNEAPAAQVQALRADLEQSPDVADVRYVSPEEAHREAEAALEGVPRARPVSVGSMPATLRVRAVSESAAARLSFHMAPVIDHVRTSADARAFACSRIGLRYHPEGPADRPSPGPNVDERLGAPGGRSRSED